MRDELLAKIRESIEVSERLAEAASHLWAGRALQICEGLERTHAAGVAAGCAALLGRRTHLMTLRDELAAHDADRIATLLEPLPIRVAALGRESDAHRADIVVGSWARFAGDFLRDHRAAGAAAQVTRRAVFLIVDHADAIALDSAPRLNATLGDPVDPEGFFEPVTGVVEGLVRELHFEGSGPTVGFTDAGFERLESALTELGLLQGQSLHHGSDDLLLVVARACLQARLLQRGRDYRVEDGTIISLDRGEPIERRLPTGVLQAVEARERLPLSPAKVVWGRCTFRSHARRYPARAALLTSGLGIERELQRRFGWELASLPRRSRRLDHEDVVHPDRAAQHAAIRADVEAARKRGRRVWVGSTRPELRAALPDDVLVSSAKRGESFGGSWSVIGCGRAGEPRFDELLCGSVGDVDLETRFHVSPEDELFESLGSDGFLDLGVNERVAQCQRRVIDRESTKRAARARIELFLEEQQVAFYGWRQRIVRGRGNRAPTPAMVDAIAAELERTGSEQLYARFGVQLDEDEHEQAAEIIAAGITWQRNQLHAFFGVVMRDVLDEAREITGRPVRASDRDAIIEAHRAVLGVDPLEPSEDAAMLAAPYHAAIRGQMRRVAPRLVLRHFRLVRLDALDRAWRDHLETAVGLRDGILPDARAKGRPLARHRARLFAALADSMVDARSQIARALIPSFADGPDELRDRCRALRERWTD